MGFPGRPGCADGTPPARGRIPRRNIRINSHRFVELPGSLTHAYLSGEQSRAAASGRPGPSAVRPARPRAGLLCPVLGNEGFARKQHDGEGRGAETRRCVLYTCLGEPYRVYPMPHQKSVTGLLSPSRHRLLLMRPPLGQVLLCLVAQAYQESRLQVAAAGYRPRYRGSMPAIG